MRALVSKQYCSKSEKVFTVRRRPCVINGGGFVVFDDGEGGSDVFRVDGCGPLYKNHAILADPLGNPILSIKKQVGLVQVFSMKKQWKGLVTDGIDGIERPIFKASTPSVSCIPHQHNTSLKVKLSMVEDEKNGEFDVVGDFAERSCFVHDGHGHVVAEVKNKHGIKAILKQDIYSVIVKPGIDQAFIFGVVAVLERLEENR